jgi:hypothetical protein
MKPIKVEWMLGRDRHGRAVTLTRTAEGYVLRREQANQRDESIVVHDLTLDMLKAIGEVASAE